MIKLVAQNDEHPSFKEMPVETQRAVARWITESLTAREAPLPSHTSYTLKHILQFETGIYIPNDAFKEAMVLCGFFPVNQNDLNWTFRISLNSPVFHRKKEKRGYGMLWKD